MKIIIYRFLFVALFAMTLLAACNDNQAYVGRLEENRELVLFIKSPQGNSNGRAVASGVETINRLDVFVYASDATDNAAPEDYLQPAQDAVIDNKWVAIMNNEDVYNSRTPKDVYVVANYAFEGKTTEQLKELKLSELRNIQLIRSKAQTETGVFTCYKMLDDNNKEIQTDSLILSACLKNNEFGQGRVLEVPLERTYSKIKLKFVYDYNKDEEKGGVTHISVGLRGINNVPLTTPLFPSITTTISFVDDVFAAGKMLMVEGSEITPINSTLDDSRVVYDLFEENPWLQIFPNRSIDKQNATSIDLTLKLLKGTSHVRTFYRTVEISSYDKTSETHTYSLTNNVAYLVTVYINRMDVVSDISCQVIPWNYVRDNIEI